MLPAIETRVSFLPRPLMLDCSLSVLAIASTALSPSPSHPISPLSKHRWMDRPRPTARPPFRPSVVYVWRYYSSGSYRGNELLFPTRRLRPRPFVRPSDRSGTLGARPMHRVGLRHLSTLPLPLVRRREDGQPNARAAAGRSFGMRLATGDGATSDRLPGRQAGHTHGPTVGRTATPRRRRRRRRAKKEWSLG